MTGVHRIATRAHPQQGTARLYIVETPMSEHPYAHQILLDDRTAAQSLIGTPGPTPLY